LTSRETSLFQDRKLTTSGNVWPALGGSILVAIFNGGPPGVLYEFITVSVFYWIVAASIAELASAIPSSAGVYHWASVTPGRKWGRVNGEEYYLRRLLDNYLPLAQASSGGIGIGSLGSSAVPR
jgi:amino acid transporter